MKIWPALLCIVAAAPQPVPHSIPAPDTIAGAALFGTGKFLGWGASLHEWTLPGLQSRSLAAGPFGEGGCVVDLDRNGSPELIVVAGSGLGRLVRLQPPQWTPELIDTEVEMHDCIEATLFGRRGVLMIQRGIQVRFYERTPAGKWISRDIYSIYTPSYQGGLALTDVDGDGRLDIYCGNYWIRSPESFELPWHIFAINTWSEVPESATMRLVPMGDRRLIVAQGHLKTGRVAVFTRPEDPRQQWPVLPLADLAKPHGLALWNGSILAGEDNGESSALCAFSAQGQQLWSTRARGGIHTILPLDARQFLTVGPEIVTHWSQRPRR